MKLTSFSGSMLLKTRLADNVLNIVPLSVHVVQPLGRRILRKPEEVAGKLPLSPSGDILQRFRIRNLGPDHRPSSSHVNFIVAFFWPLLNPKNVKSLRAGYQKTVGDGLGVRFINTMPIGCFSAGLEIERG
jgi:hypothetical protein